MIRIDWIFILCSFILLPFHIEAKSSEVKAKPNSVKKAASDQVTLATPDDTKKLDSLIIESGHSKFKLVFDGVEDDVKTNQKYTKGQTDNRYALKFKKYSYKKVDGKFKDTPSDTPEENGYLNPNTNTDTRKNYFRYGELLTIFNDGKDMDSPKSSYKQGGIAEAESHPLSKAEFELLLQQLAGDKFKKFSKNTSVKNAPTTNESGKTDKKPKKAGR